MPRATAERRPPSAESGELGIAESTRGQRVAALIVAGLKIELLAVQDRLRHYSRLGVELRPRLEDSRLEQQRLCRRVDELEEAIERSEDAARTLHGPGGGLQLSTPPETVPRCSPSAHGLAGKSGTRRAQNRGQ